MYHPKRESPLYHFTIIEAEEAKEVETLVTELSALTAHEVHPTYEVGEGEYCDPMHGPV